MENELVSLLLERKKTVTTAESCTGGRIAAAITAVPGSSGVFPGGVVSYCDRVKHRILGVPEALLDEYTAVSEPVCRAMAEGAARLMETDFALSATGLAGPDGDEIGTPVGTVYLGLYAGGETICKKCLFSGSRNEIQAQAAETALRMLQTFLEGRP